MIIKRLIQILIIATPCLLLVWLLVIDIAPSGLLTVDQEVDEHDTGLVHQLLDQPLIKH